MFFKYNNLIILKRRTVLQLKQPLICWEFLNWLSYDGEKTSSVIFGFFASSMSNKSLTNFNRLVNYASNPNYIGLTIELE